MLWLTGSAPDLRGSQVPSCSQSTLWEESLGGGHSQRSGVALPPPLCGSHIGVLGRAGQMDVGAALGVLVGTIGVWGRLNLPPTILSTFRKVG